LAIRSDALARLDALKPALPQILSNTLRLQHLDRPRARAAITGALAARNAGVGEDERVEIEPALVEAVLDEVSDPASAERRVEAPYLRLGLQRVWDEEAGAGSRVLRASTLAELGGAQRVVREHVGRALARLSPADQDVAARVFDHLITPSGTKIAHVPSDLARWSGVDEAGLRPVLDELTDQR